MINQMSIWGFVFGFSLLNSKNGVLGFGGVEGGEEDWDGNTLSAVKHIISLKCLVDAHVKVFSE